FEHVQPNSGMAYVVILHLSPDYSSKLAEILSRSTELPVTQVEKKTKMEPDHVYVIAPNHHLQMEDGSILILKDQKEEDRRAPVVIFSVRWQSLMVSMLSA